MLDFKGGVSASASATASCSTSPPADHAWSHLQDDYSIENELTDINYSQNGIPGRRFSLSCASDAETVITASQPQPQLQHQLQHQHHPQAGVSWLGSQFNQFNNSDSLTALIGSYGTHFQQRHHHQAPFLPTSHSMPILPATNNAARHTRKRTHNVIDYAPGTDKANKRGCANGSGSGQMSQEAGYLLHTLAQNPAQVQAQLSQGQRPPIFDQIYRAQMAHQLALKRAASLPEPTATDEDPMMPSMSSMEQMQAVHAAQTTSSLLSYNFPQSTPNLHSINDTQQNGNVASVFYAMHNSADGAALDISDPAMLDCFLGIGGDSSETASNFGWPR